MAVPTYSELKNLAFDRAQINATVDAPVSDTEFARFINDALRDVWEISGGQAKRATSANSWARADTATGTAMGLLTDIAEITHLYYTTQAAVTVAATTINAATSLTRASGSFITDLPTGFNWEISAADETLIKAGTRVASIVSALVAVLPRPAVGSGSQTMTFTPTASTTELDRVPLSRIQWLRRNGTAMPTYLVPKEYSITRMVATAPTLVNQVQLDWWPSVSGFYFPIEYVPQFAEIDSATVTTPALNDIEARDGGLICAARLAQAVGRFELVDGILADISERTRIALNRKLSAMADARQHAGAG